MLSIKIIVVMIWWLLLSAGLIFSLLAQSQLLETFFCRIPKAIKCPQGQSDILATVIKETMYKTLSTGSGTKCLIKVIIIICWYVETISAMVDVETCIRTGPLNFESKILTETPYQIPQEREIWVGIF